MDAEGIRMKNEELRSGQNRDLQLPVSELALSLEYIGAAMSDMDCFYWRISPIDDGEGKSHLFVPRWKIRHDCGAGMDGWKNICEIAHCVRDSAEGPFQVADAKAGFGLLSDYMTIPSYATKSYIGEPKFERPAVLMRDGKPAYFYAASGLNVEGNEGTENFVLKVNLPLK